MPPYCPISSTLPHTFTTPTTTTGQLPNSFWPTFVAIAANTFLTRMHFFSLKALAPLATNSYSRNRSLSHEPKTHSPPPPPPPPTSLSAKQAAQAIQSSPLALFPPLPHTTSYTTRARHIVFGNVFALRTFAPQSGAPLLPMPSQARDTSTKAFLLRALQVGVWECFRTSHLEIQAQVGPGRDRFATFLLAIAR